MSDSQKTHFPVYITWLQNTYNSIAFFSFCRDMIHPIILPTHFQLLWPQLFKSNYEDKLLMPVDS